MYGLPRLKRAARPVPVEEPGIDELAAARAQAAAEADRLAVPPSDEAARRDALDDLATRLDALVRHLESLGLNAAPLRAIAKLVRDDSVPSAERWTRAAEQLRAFARPSGRGAFWKRGTATR
jgi:hypothetical protein